MLLAAAAVVMQALTAPRARTGIDDTSVPSHEAMSANAARVLRNIVEARAKIHSGEAERAEAALSSALALVDRIKAARPSTRVADHVWVMEQHLDLEKTHEVALDLIPIDISLADLEDVASVQRAQQYLEDTRMHLKEGDFFPQLRASLPTAAIPPPPDRR